MGTEGESWASWSGHRGLVRDLGHIFRKFLSTNPVSQIAFPENFMPLKIVIFLFPFPNSLSPLKSHFPREV